MSQACYHCGDVCVVPVVTDGKAFCCNGCRQVYLLLQQNKLCAYYDLKENPGIKARGKFSGARFDYLNDPSILPKLAEFVDDTLVHINFSLPAIHCTSCVFLLENLHKIEPGVIRSRVNFPQKKLFIAFDPSRITLRKLVELLAFVGYEPSLSLAEMKKKEKISFGRRRIFELGVAGFCFANIMMLSFPEYFSGGIISEPGLKQTFTWLIFFLSIPVLVFSARGFFVSGFKGLRQGVLNIDLPIALAIFITFARSYYEIISATGSGYLDSGTGIIFFMLIGRWFQDKTYSALSFDRDYLSYFPLGVSVIRDGKEINIPVTELNKGEEIILRHGDMIPADSLLLKGEGLIDYSFVTGENNPVSRKSGEVLHAGGKQCGGKIVLKVIKEPSQSYITGLWNDLGSIRKNKTESFIHPWSRYFTLVLFTIALAGAFFWYVINPSMILPVVSAVLIVACPCSLLLTATFTFGHMMRILGRNKLFLKNAAVIETIASADTIVFDKTGTITLADGAEVTYSGDPLSRDEKMKVAGLGEQSSHTLSRQVVRFLGSADSSSRILSFRETPGVGISALVGNERVALGRSDDDVVFGNEKVRGSRVYASIGNRLMGYFEIRNSYREGAAQAIYSLRKMGYSLHLLSGDNDTERSRLESWFDQDKISFFNSPSDKLDYVHKLQALGHKVIMIGDGLNDAGALLQSDAGIAVNDSSGSFTPASDAIMDGSIISRLPALIRYMKASKKIISIGFAISLLYNIIGLTFAIQGRLSPMTAAILMPASSITLVSLSSLFAAVFAKKHGL